MHYWNRGNFEGLDGVAADARASSMPDGFAEYCTLRSSGRRAEAFAALRGFVVRSLTLPLAERKHVVSWLLEAQLRAPQIHQLLPFPLMSELVKPTLEAWVSTSPGDASAHRWCGFVFGNADSLRMALEIDRSDQPARILLIERLLSWVEFATHHLAEGRLLEDAGQIAAQLEEISSHLSELPHSRSASSLAARLHEQAALLADWTEYQQNPQGAFPDWCAKRQKVHEWPSIHYYGPSGDA